MKLTHPHRVALSPVHSFINQPVGKLSDPVSCWAAAGLCAGRLSGFIRPLFLNPASA
jgi:hypothetical protein